jgi:hypothetical protein
MAPMKAADRCDRCMAQAVVSLDSLDWVAQLLMCGHHYEEHRPELTRLGVFVVDDREERVTTP